MFETVKSAAILFFQNKLFKDPAQVYRQLGIGIGLTVVAFLILAKFTGMPIAGVIAGFIGGAVQPTLFKDLKFR